MGDDLQCGDGNRAGQVDGCHHGGAHHRHHIGHQVVEGAAGADEEVGGAVAVELILLPQPLGQGAGAHDGRGVQAGGHIEQDTDGDDGALGGAGTDNEAVHGLDHHINAAALFQQVDLGEQQHNQQDGGSLLSRVYMASIHFQVYFHICTLHFLEEEKCTVTEDFYTVL